MYVYEFMNQTKDKHLTIGDIRCLSVGAQLDIVVWGDVLRVVPDAFERRTLTYLGQMQARVQDQDQDQVQAQAQAMQLEIGRYHLYWNWADINDDIVTIGNAEDPDFKILELKDVPDHVRVGWNGEPIMLWAYV